MNVAEALIQTLVNRGVHRIYGVCGDSLNGVTEAVRSSKSVDWIHTRHEETAAFAAGAEAHLTGNLAVCAGSCGPGNLHLINGLYDCHRSRVPVLAIAAHINMPEIGTGYFQETRPEQIFSECSHFSAMISDPQQVPRVLDIAIRHAIFERGVSVIVLPGDVALKELEGKFVDSFFPQPKFSVTPDEDSILRLADLLNAGKKVTLLGGAGCAGARQELIALAEKLKAPIVHALRGKEFIEYDNPYDVGMTGLLGFSSGYRAMMHCDTLLLVGTDFPYSQFYPQDAKIAQIDIRGEQIGRRCKVDVGIVGDVSSTIKALLPKLIERRESDHLDDAVEHYRKARKDLDFLANEASLTSTIHPQYLTQVVDELADEDAIFTCDVGTPTVWAARYLKMNGRRRLIGSFVHGSMAGALPQAIGAQLAHPERQVIALCGDGGLAMCMGDLLSLRQLELPIKVIVYRNDALAFVELEMKAAGQLDFATDLLNPDFSQIGTASGLLSIKATSPQEVRDAIQKALQFEGPALVEVQVARQELSMPPSISAQQVKGFGVFMLKAVLNGRGDEVIDLAKTNILR